MQSGRRVPWFVQFAIAGAVIGFLQGCILSVLAGGAEGLPWRSAYAVFIGLHGALVGGVVGLALGTGFYLLLFRGTMTQVIVYIVGASCLASGLVSAVAFHVWWHDGSEMMSVFVMLIVAAMAALIMKVWTAVHTHSWR